MLENTVKIWTVVNLNNTADRIFSRNIKFNLRSCNYIWGDHIL